MITLLLILKFFQSTKLTPHILFFFFFYFITMYFFLLSSFFFNLKKNSLHTYFFFFFFFFFLWLEKVEILNYNKCKLLIFTQKIEESLNQHNSMNPEPRWLILSDPLDFHNKKKKEKAVSHKTLIFQVIGPTHKIS